MKASFSLARDGKKLVNGLAGLRSSRIFKDRLSVVLLLVAAGVNLLNLVVLIMHTPATRTYVPTHYSSLVGFEGLGPWYWPFAIAIFGLFVTAVNFMFALLTFDRSRLIGFYLMAAAATTGLFCLIVSNAFAMVIQ
jgi:hypothetical protein